MEVSSMAIVRWDPARELDTLQTEFNRLFDVFSGSRPDARTHRWLPAMDLVESGENLVLRADLPGMKRDDVEIEVKENVLTIAGERRTDNEEKADGYYRVERASGRFSRSLTLPEGIDADAITADFTDGVLEVRIPKPEERKPHRVAIGPGVIGGEAKETTADSD
jgi:HSP20 family protein